MNERICLSIPLFLRIKTGKRHKELVVHVIVLNQKPYVEKKTIKDKWVVKNPLVKFILMTCIVSLSTRNEWNSYIYFVGVNYSECYTNKVCKFLLYAQDFPFKWFCIWTVQVTLQFLAKDVYFFTSQVCWTLLTMLIVITWVNLRPKMPIFLKSVCIRNRLFQCFAFMCDSCDHLELTIKRGITLMQLCWSMNLAQTCSTERLFDVFVYAF